MGRGEFEEARRPHARLSFHRQKMRKPEDKTAVTAGRAGAPAGSEHAAQLTHLRRREEQKATHPNY